MLNKINLYVFIQILKSCTLIFFIFLSISWLLQLTRLLTLTNLIQIDLLNVIYLSLFLIPNLLTVIIPFILIFGILLCFIKLNRDKELTAIYTLGLELKPIKYSFAFFSILIFIFYLLLNLYFSPIIYEKYKLKEFELRNTINLDRIVISNFLKLNENTIIDFKKNNNSYEDLFISYKDEKENIIFAKKGFISDDKNQYIFQLNDGFKISINNNEEIEKLEFKKYVLKFNNENIIEFNNYDRNTLTLFDNLATKNYLNILFSFSDVYFALLILIFFYYNNITKINLNLKNNIFFIIVSVTLLIINTIIKNYSIEINFYIMIIFALTFIILSIIKLKGKYE